MTSKKTTPGAPKVSRDVSAFLRDAAVAPARATQAQARARLGVVIDATMSREATWDAAMAIQGEMFDAADKLGGLLVRLTFFRGIGECKASAWTADALALGRAMSRVRCRAGATQYGRALGDLLREARATKLGAFVVIGDAFEEDIDAVAAVAGELGMLGVRGFFFHEGRDGVARRMFEELARATGGVCVAFDASSPEVLRGLLGAAAAYAAGGKAALTHYASRRGGAAGTIAARLTGPSSGGGA